MTPQQAGELFTAEELDTLRHMLGINTPWVKRPEPTRDYFATGAGDLKMVWLELLGAVRLYATDWPLNPSLHWYCTTALGRAVAMASFKPYAAQHEWYGGRRRMQGARRYSKFLDYKECDSRLTFKKFLTQPEYAEARKAA